MLAFSDFDIGRSLAVLSGLDRPLLLLGLAVATPQLLCQVLRFGVFLPVRAADVPPLTVTRVVVTAQLLNVVAPLRTGDVYKVAGLANPSLPSRFTPSQLAAGLLGEKIADATTLLALSGAGGIALLQAALRDHDVSTPVVVGASSAALAVVLLLSWWIRRSSPRRLRTFFHDVRRALVSWRMAASVGIAGGAWLLEATSARLIIASAGYEIGFGEVLVVLLVLNLGIAVPIAVANIGVFEATVAFALGTFGIPAEAGVAIGTAYHISMTATLAVWTALLWAMKRRAKPTT